MITVIQLLCIAAFIVGWVYSGFRLYQGDAMIAGAAALFAIASYYAYTLAGASIPQTRP